MTTPEYCDTMRCRIEAFKAALYTFPQHLRTSHLTSGDRHLNAATQANLQNFTSIETALAHLEKWMRLKRSVLDKLFHCHLLDRQLDDVAGQAAPFDFDKALLGRVMANFVGT